MNEEELVPALEKLIHQKGQLEALLESVLSCISLNANREVLTENNIGKEWMSLTDQWWQKLNEITGAE